MENISTSKKSFYVVFALTVLSFFWLYVTNKKTINTEIYFTPPAPYPTTSVNDISSMEALTSVNFDTIYNSPSVSYSSTPEAKMHKFCRKFDTVDRSKITSIEFSKIHTINVFSGTVTVTIRTYDLENRPKSSGGDFNVIWARQMNGDGLISGHVVDHKNGTYTGLVNIFWSGPSQIRVKLLSSMVNTCLRMEGLRKYGNIGFIVPGLQGIRVLLSNNHAHEYTECGISPYIYHVQNFCNFTASNGGEYWYCGQPKNRNLACSDAKSLKTGGFDHGFVPKSEMIEQNYGYGLFYNNIVLNVDGKLRTVNESCKSIRPAKTWKTPIPSGYWSSGQWNSLHCYSHLEHTKQSYRTCLTNKTLVLLGDSTIRQYAEYFIEHVLDRGDVHAKIKHAVGPFGKYHTEKVYTNYGITVLFARHEMPYRVSTHAFTFKGILSIPQMVQEIGGKMADRSLIIVVSYFSHFVEYPLDSYRERVRHLAKAVQILFKVKPKTKVFFKSPHVFKNKVFDPHIAFIYKQIVKEEFSLIMDEVIFLDVWSTTVTHNNEDIHPQANAFVSQINQLMSYIC